MLENGSDLHINERQKIRHYRIGLLKNKKNEEECQIAIIFFTSRGTYVNGAITSDVIHSFDWNNK